MKNPACHEGQAGHIFFASSAEFVGEFRLGKVAKLVI
jgi:hypothetical protein